MKILTDSPTIMTQLENQTSGLNDMQLEVQVAQIIEQVRLSGDKALFEFSQTFDKVNLTTLRVANAELEAAYQRCDQAFRAALDTAKANIVAFHEKQKNSGYLDASQPGILLGRKVTPIQRVGLYIPGGTASYPSTVLMNALPAKIAGCPHIVMTSPPSANGKIADAILAAAWLCEVDEVYMIGGAQAIAALAYGTQTITKVDKICGPGNAYVAMAKKQVSGQVGIDMIAGPSEILVVADDAANPAFVASDLIAQGEHDPNARAMLICLSNTFAQAVNQQLDQQLKQRQRTAILNQSLNRGSFILVVESLERAIALANQLAPEHLALEVSDPIAALSEITNAGSIFLGSYTPEAVGDYVGGPNHTLPTNSTARFSSGLSVDDFIKKSTFLYYTKDALQSVASAICTLAEHEGLDGHGASVSERLKEDQ